MAAAIRKLEGLSDLAVIEVALRQVLPCHVVIQTAYIVTACDPAYLALQPALATSIR